MIIPNIWENKKRQPNHQPDHVIRGVSRPRLPLHRRRHGHFRRCRGDRARGQGNGRGGGLGAGVSNGLQGIPGRLTDGRFPLSTIKAKGILQEKSGRKLTQINQKGILECKNTLFWLILAGNCLQQKKWFPLSKCTMSMKILNSFLSGRTCPPKLHFLQTDCSFGMGQVTNHLQPPLKIEQFYV